MLILALITVVIGLDLPETGAGLHTIIQAGYPLGRRLFVMKLRADLLSFFRWRRRWRRGGRSLAGCLFAYTVIHMNSAARLVCHGITFWWVVEGP